MRSRRNDQRECQVLELFAPNSHDAHYFFQLLESLLFLQLKNPEYKTVRLNLLPVDFRYRSLAKQIIFRQVIRITRWSALKIPKLKKISLDKGTKFRLIAITLASPSSLYSAIKTRKMNTITYDNIKIEIHNYEIGLWKRILQIRKSNKIASRIMREISSEIDSIKVKSFFSLEYSGVNIGELIVSTALSKDLSLAGEFRVTSNLHRELVNGIAMVDFSYHLKLQEKAFVTTHEPVYLESVYKRALHAAGASVLETFNYKSKYLVVPPGAKIPIPWIAEDSNQVCSDQKFVDFFRKRLFDTEDTDLWYMNGNSNQNHNKSIMDTKGNQLNVLNNQMCILICLHSFIDAQHAYGIDDFSDYHDFFRTCIDVALLNPAVPNIFVKLHPNVDYVSEGIEKIAFMRIQDRYKNEPRVIFLSATTSLVALSELNNLVAITHHGSVAEELVFLGVPVIASNRSPWSDLYRFTTIFETRADLVREVMGISLEEIQDPSERQIYELKRFITEYRFNSFSYRERLLSERIFTRNGPFGDLSEYGYEERANFFESISQDSDQLSKLFALLLASFNATNQGQ